MAEYIQAFADKSLDKYKAMMLERKLFCLSQLMWKDSYGREIMQNIKSS